MQEKLIWKLSIKISKSLNFIFKNPNKIQVNIKK